ncbi:MAG TPA: MFS transporter [Bryobacteraceae bacterium]|jgi:MFS family permease|nr:MFS transporter [Bryobacteraceae bacterium]
MLAKRIFYGWWIVATAFVTFGIAVGIPYYNIPFFYDYFQKNYHWSLDQITLGFPLAALLTIWVGPLLIPRFSPRKLIVAGTGLTAVAFFGFGAMKGALSVYFLLYFIYTVGYLFSGPIPHQILVSYWFQKKRGTAMGIVYVGVGLFGGLGSFFVRSMTDRYGFQTALMAVGALMLISWPLAIFILKDKPGEVGLLPDGAAEPPPDIKLSPHSYWVLLRNGPFWLLLLGSICSIGSIGSINMHMKFVFRDAGFTNQKVLNATWTTASVLILWSSIIGRISIGYFADVFSKKRVMTATYFIVAATILLLLSVTPAHYSSIYIFAIMFGFSMGADYMLIPLMAAEQFGVNSLARAMAIILPANTIGQTWLPYMVSGLREHYGNYLAPMAVIFGIAMIGALAIAIMPASKFPFESPQVANPAGTRTVE